MSRVFVYELVKNDLQAAALHGELVYLWDERRRRPSIWETDDFIEATLDRLYEMHFDPRNDYFVIVGPTVATTLIVAALVLQYPEIRLLFWHAEHREYLVRAIRREYHNAH